MKYFEINLAATAKLAAGDGLLPWRVYFPCQHLFFWFHIICFVAYGHELKQGFGVILYSTVRFYAWQNSGEGVILETVACTDINSRCYKTKYKFTLPAIMNLFGDPSVWIRWKMSLLLMRSLDFESGSGMWNNNSCSYQLFSFYWELFAITINTNRLPI